ncbi:transposase [Rhizobium leguminosarum]|uniref:IS66 family transposase n=1 Tax=Rhizobium leguminosarum TaxID=384 RepID=UPI0039657B2A
MRPKPLARVAARRQNSAAIVKTSSPFARRPAAGLRQIQTGGGLRDAISRRDIFERFLADGRVEIDSNIVERAIRPQAIKRKNSLFCRQQRQWKDLGGGRNTRQMAR